MSETEASASGSLAHSGATVVTDGSSGGMFARNATGLVRGVPPRSALMMNIVPGHPAFVLAVSFFFIFSLFPGGNYLLGLALVIPLSIAMAYSWGLLLAMIPRSGGDYVLVSRVLHPLVGVISSFCQTAAVVLSVAFFGVAISTLAVGPGLISIGLIGNAPSLVDAGNTVLESKNWQFVIGAATMVLATIPLLGGWRFTLRIQYIWFWMTTGALAVCVLIALFTSHSAFIGHFNDFAKPFTDSGSSYNDTIKTAVKSGVDVDPAFSFTNTIPVLGFFCGWAIFNYFGSANIGGELRQAATIKTPQMMALGGVIPIVAVAICAALFFRTFGTDFQIAANGGGMPEQIAAPATYTFLTSITVGSSLFAAVIVICFAAFFPLIMYLNFLQPARMLFAYAFDGILPTSVTKLTRSGVPYIAVLIALALSVLTLIWGLNASSFLQIVTYAILIQLISMGLVGLCAVVVPYRHPELYRASVTKRVFLGLPVISWAGLGTVATSVLVWILYFHYDEAFGFTDKVKFLSYVAGIIVLAIAFYLGARYVRSRQGVDVSLAYAEIPPE